MKKSRRSLLTICWLPYADVSVFTKPQGQAIYYRLFMDFTGGFRALFFRVLGELFPVVFIT